MREQQRLELERELATVRRALHRAIAIAERGAYYGIEDALHIINADAAAVMDTIMKGREHVNMPLRTSA